VQEHPKLRHVCADLRDPAARRALEGVDVLWHLGFQLWRDHRDPGSRRAAEPIPETHPPRPNPECPYAGQKLEAERLCAGAAPWAALRISAVLGPHADPMVRRAAMGYRRVVPAIRGAPQAVQFLHEDDAAEALHRAGSARVTGVVNVATPDWLTEADVSRLTGGRVLRLPRRLMLSLAEAAWRARLVGFGADRAVLISGPLALDWRLASGVLGWTASRGSAPVLAEFVTEAGQTRRS
jgi:nucleoside-diphosphate-sugar epimerase